MEARNEDAMAHISVYSRLVALSPPPRKAQDKKREAQLRTSRVVMDKSESRSREVLSS